MDKYFLAIIAIIFFSILGILYIRIIGKDRDYEKFEEKLDNQVVDNFTILE